MGIRKIAHYRNTLMSLLALPLFAVLGCTVDNPDPSVTTGGSGSGGAAGGGAGGAMSGAGGILPGGAGSSGASSMGGSGGGATAGSGGAGGAGGASAGTGGGGSGGSGVDPNTLEKFSFFVTSMKAMRRLSKSENGFGGDLRYGTADGLTGADKICTEIAETSMPGSGAKEWHAFLSTTQVNARTRIGDGPWYDRTGRLVASDLANLIDNIGNDGRPVDADDAIKEDLPNEDGVPNHRPDPNAEPDDNHHTLTGSNAMGELYGPKATCLDWTTTSMDNEMTGRPRIGFMWSISNRVNWISGQDEGGCGAGVTGVGTVNGGSDPNNPIVGSGGGYGAIYCFAMIP
jgi:hypothetical protein